MSMTIWIIADLIHLRMPLVRGDDPFRIVPCQFQNIFRWTLRKKSFFARLHISSIDFCLRFCRNCLVLIIRIANTLGEVLRQHPHRLSSVHKVDQIFFPISPLYIFAPFYRLDRTPQLLPLLHHWRRSAAQRLIKPKCHICHISPGRVRGCDFDQ